MKLRNLKTIKDRRRYIEKKLKIELNSISKFPVDLEQAQFKNCENMIGAVQLPLGIAGPLKIKGKYARGEYYLPLATTEGALVASVNRGCKAISNAGGAVTVTDYKGISRGVVFQTGSLTDGFQVKNWLEKNFKLLSQKSGQTSGHLKLLNIETRIVGTNVFVRFSFDTQDAMGMNMATFTTDELSKLISRETGARLVSLAGNFDIDKKPAWLNFILGRGRQVWAEVKLNRVIIRNVLKTTPEEVNKVCLKKCQLGSSISGSMGFNAQFANVVAAIFIACGQDPGHIAEGSLGITTTEIIDSDLLVSVFLPDLSLGTVGGGTGLPSQKETLQILGVDGGAEGKNAAKMAEIIVAAVLAGEISLLASLAEGSLATSHQRLGRLSPKLLR